MQPTNAGLLGNRPPAGSKKRLMDYERNLSLDRTGRLFDREVLPVLGKYVRKPTDLERVVTYLAKDCVDSDGYPFSRSLKLYKTFEANYDGFAKTDYTSFRWNRNYQQALEEVKKEFSRSYLSPLRFTSDADIKDAIPKKDTHSGWSYILSGIKEKGEYMDGIFEDWLSEVNTAISNGTLAKPILPGIRTQCSGAFDEQGGFTGVCKHKARLVAMIDIFQIITELQFAKPFQRSIGSFEFYAGSKNPNQISRIIGDMRARYHYYLSIDYSGFDQSLSSWLIYDAFDCIKAAFKKWDERYEAMWNIVVHDFVHKTFIKPDGHIDSHRGVPSGSMFTQIIDTIINRILIKTFMIKENLKGRMIIMGDDNLVYFERVVDYKDLKSYLEKNFGVKISDSKVSYGLKTVDPEFLSRTWKPGGQWRHPHELIGLLLYPERRRVYNDQVTPELVIYSYIFAYGKGMDELIDVQKFLEENCFDHRSLRSLDSRDMPGYLKYYFGYVSPTA